MLDTYRDPVGPVILTSVGKKYGLALPPSAFLLPPLPGTWLACRAVMDHLWLAFGIALGIASQPVTGQDGRTAQPVQQAPATNAPLKAGVDRHDAKFIERAARAAHAEIAAGKLAAARGSSGEVKAFAREVVEHHGKA